MGSFSSSQSQEVAEQGPCPGRWFGAGTLHPASQLGCSSPGAALDELLNPQPPPPGPRNASCSDSDCGAASPPVPWGP